MMLSTTMDSCVTLAVPSWLRRRMNVLFPAALRLLMPLSAIICCMLMRVACCARPEVGIAVGRIRGLAPGGRNPA